MVFYGANWASNVKSISDNLELSYMWVQQNEMNIPLDIIKQRIFDNYYQSWYAVINNSNRLIMYSIYKHDFSQENYLDFISNKNIRTALTRFRLSSHDLAVESGRYDDTPRSDRLCKFSSLNVVENEYHFLLVCPL